MATAANLREAEVIWRPNPGQQEKFHRAKEFEVLYGGARGGGKTDSLLMEATRQVWHPHYRGILFRRELKRAEDMIERSLKLYKRAFPGAKFNANEAKWYFPSGATIQFGHLQHEHNKYDYIGREFQYIAFDQLEEFTQTQYLFLMGSCRTSHPELRCYIRASANPGGPGHNWVKQRFITPAPPETTIIDPVSGRTRKFIPAGPYDNPKLDPSYLQSLKMLPEKLQKAWIEGDWDTFQGQLFEEWDPEIHVLKEHFEPPPEWPRYHALDWGSDKPYAYGLFTFLKGKPYLFAELYGWSGVPNVGTKETADRVAEKILELQKRHNALGCIGPADTQIWNKSGEVGPTIQQTFQEYGITFVKATKDRLNGRDAIFLEGLLDRRSYLTAFVPDLRVGRPNAPQGVVPLLQFQDLLGYAVSSLFGTDVRYTAPAVKLCEEVRLALQEREEAVGVWLIRSPVERMVARPLRRWLEVLLQNVNLRVPLLEKLALEGIPVAFDPSLLELLGEHFERLEVTRIELWVVIGTRRDKLPGAPGHRISDRRLGWRWRDEPLRHPVVAWPSRVRRRAYVASEFGVAGAARPHRKQVLGLGELFQLV